MYFILSMYFKRASLQGFDILIGCSIFLYPSIIADFRYIRKYFSLSMSLNTVSIIGFDILIVSSLFICPSTSPSTLLSIYRYVLLSFYVLQQEPNTWLRYIGMYFSVSMSFNVFNSLLRYIGRYFLSVSFDNASRPGFDISVGNSFFVCQIFNTWPRYISRQFSLSINMTSIPDFNISIAISLFLCPTRLQY